MADLEKTVSIIFSGVDKTSGAITGISKNLDQLSGSVSSVAQPLADMAGAVLKTEAALAALAAGGLAYAYAKSIEFEGAVIDLQKVLGDDAGHVDAARQAALDLSNQYGTSATDVLQSTANFKQAGFDIQDSMQLTKNALDLVIAGDIEAASASDLLIAALKGFDAPASEATRLIDILNGVSNEYATNVNELAIGMAELSPIASTMGFSFEETAGVLTPIIEIFRSGGEAAVALKTGLLKLVDDAKPVKEALASIGVSQTDLNGNMRSGKDILMDVSTAFTTLDESQKLVVASQLVGVEQAARMVTVFDNLGKSTDITNTALNSAGSAVEEVALRLASGEVAVLKFGVGFQNLATAVGDNFRDATTSAINGATEIENTLQSLAGSGVFNELFGVFESMSTNMGELFKGIAEALPGALEQIDWSGFTGSIENLGDTIGGLFSAFFDGADLTTAEGLAAAIQKIVDAMTILTNVTSGILSVFEPFIGLMSDAIDYFAEGGEGAQKFAGELMGWGAVLASAAAALGVLALAIKGMTGTVAVLTGLKGGASIASIGSAAASATGTITSLAGALTKAVGSAGVVTSGGFLGLAAAAGYAAGTILNENVPAITTVSQKILGWVDSVVNFTGTQKSANQKIKENEAFLAAQGLALERVGDSVEGLDSTIAGANLTAEPELETKTFDENLAIVEARMREFEASGEPIEISATNFEALETFQQTAHAWDLLSFGANGNVKVNTNFSQIEREWETINKAISSDDDHEIAYKTTYKWTDSNGTPHITDAPPDIDEAIGDIEEIKTPVKVDVDDKSVDKAKKKIKKSFSKAEMGPIDLSFDFGGGSGTGPVGGLKKEFEEMEPIPVGDVLDLSGLSDLIDSISGMERQVDRHRMAQEALKMAAAQRELTQAEARNLRVRAAVAEQETRNIEKLSGSFDNVIKIEAQGLEPEMEAFMWKLLKKIQTRANASAAEFLLAAAS